MGSCIRSMALQRVHEIANSLYELTPYMIRGERNDSQLGEQRLTVRQEATRSARRQERWEQQREQQQGRVQRPGVQLKKKLHLV